MIEKSLPSASNFCGSEKCSGWTLKCKSSPIILVVHTVRRPGRLHEPRMRRQTCEKIKPDKWRVGSTHAGEPRGGIWLTLNPHKKPVLFMYDRLTGTWPSNQRRLASP